MADIINGYRLLGPLTNANAGYGRWGFAGKNGVQYFIKEFLNPIYPTKSSPYPEDIQQRIREECLRYQQEKQRLYQAVNQISDGNLLRIEEFFRWGSKYYITTLRLTPAMEPGELHRRPLEERLRVCCALCHALMRLHEKHIVHADVKADNIILVKSLQGGITVKLIDVDCSFFEDTPPEDGDELGGDQKYLSPEGFLFKYIGPEAVKLDCKMDVYAAGLLLHQLLTGKLPNFDADYNYAFEASLDNRPIVLSADLPDNIKSILACMLCSSSAQRITMKKAFLRFRDILVPELSRDSARASGNKPSVAASASKSSAFKAPAAKGSATASGKSASASDGRLKFGSFPQGAKPSPGKGAVPSQPRKPAPEASDDGFFRRGGNLL